MSDRSFGLCGRLIEKEEVSGLYTQRSHPQKQLIHHDLSQLNLTGGFGFGGLTLKDHHPCVRDQIPNTNAQNLTNATCRPTDNFSDLSVFLGQIGLDERLFLHGEDLGLS